MFNMSKFRLTAILSLIGSTPIMAADCGPGPHWIDSCPAGTYSVPTIFDVTIKEQPCDVEGGLSHHVILQGETQTNRQAAQTEPDHHIDTEIVSLSLMSDGYFFRAGKNEGMSQQSLGRITEMGDPNWARLYFDIFFQIKLPASIMGGGLHYITMSLCVSNIILIYYLLLSTIHPLMSVLSSLCLIKVMSKWLVL
jgi:hypothetical protein